MGRNRSDESSKFWLRVPPMRLLRHRRETLSKISLGTQRERWARSRKAQMEEALDARQIVNSSRVLGPRRLELRKVT